MTTVGEIWRAIGFSFLVTLTVGLAWNLLAAIWLVVLPRLI